jgi:polysaccharide biosynthesis/export protein
MNIFLRFLGLLLLANLCLVALNGCSRYSKLPAGSIKQIGDHEASPLVARELVTVSRDTPQAAPPADYLIGAGDVLAITVYGRSDLAGTGGKGSRVDVSGSIQLPLVGSVQVAGLSLQQVRDRLQTAFKQYLREPSVVVEVAEYRSHPIYLLGQFKGPGTHYMDRPTNLLQGLALGGGLDNTANLRGACLLRGTRLMAVDIYSLLHDGDQRQNIWLEGGDTIYVPDNSLQNVFVFGAVKTPGPVPMKNGRLTLHQAVAAAGGLGDAGYDPNIRIIRSLSATRGELMVVDLDRILAGDAEIFQLRDGDIVYVPKDMVANWNQAINEILPSLQAIGAILNPFVQIKFLSQ